MALPVTPPYEQYSGNPSNFIPKLYAKKVRVKYYESGVLPAISNTDYVGQIKEQGDEVIIRQRPTITINDYSKGAKITHESVSASSISLLIDKAKYYGFTLDVIDEKQSDIILSKEFIDDSAHQMETAIETEVFADIYNKGSSYNYGATAGKKSASINLGTSGAPLVLTKNNVLDFLVDMKTVLTENLVPDDDKRWAVFPPWLTGLIDKSDLRNASFSGEDKSRMFKNRYVGSLAGFNIHETTLLYDVTDGSDKVTNVIFGHKDALCFVTQLIKNRVIEPESTFGKCYDGLQVYGYKVVVPEALGWGYVAKG